MNTPNASVPHKRDLRIDAVRLAWVALIALSLGMLIASIVPGFQKYLALAKTPDFRAIGLSPDWIAVYLVAVQVVFALVCFVLGAAIFWRGSDNWMAVFVALIGSVFGVNIPLIYNLHALYPAWHLPIAFVVYFGQASGIIAIYIFPDGQFVPRWTRVLAVALGAWMLVSWPFPTAPFSPEQLPYSFLSLLMLVCASTALYAQIHRYRRVSSQVQRQQTKWVAFGLAAAVVGFLGEVMLPLVLPPLQQPGFLRVVHTLMVGPGCRLLMLVGPLSIGISILRYRLWDIDFVINRSLVYGALSVLLAIFFGLSLVVISQVTQNFVGGPLVAVAVSAAAFGAIFRPARKRLQRFVDQRFYNIHIDYQRTPAPVSAPSETDILKQTQFGAYTGLTLIGQGGMAAVYKAIHPVLGKPVAIKLLPAHLAIDPDFRHRFYREARMMSDLQHPNIVRVYDFGEENGTHYIVMEYLNGKDLGSYLHEIGRLPFTQTLSILSDVAAALDYAHAQGVVHRDVKPSNVMLELARPAIGSSDRAVLMDFGIAKIAGGHTALTRTGILGTFDYIAPEQIQASAEVDGRADVYAFGVMAYQMLTGEVPFRYENPGALLIAHLTQPPPDPRDRVPEMSSQVAYALQHVLDKKRAKRYQTAGKFVQALMSKDAGILKSGEAAAYR